jgi:hypothetical protein
MAEINPGAALPTAPRRSIGWAIALGIVLLLIGALVAVIGVVTGLLVFNGCFGPSGPVAEIVSMAWIFGAWPLAVLATALVPPALLGLGRGRRAALAAFGIGCLVAAFIWFGWLGLGYFWFC